MKQRFFLLLTFLPLCHFLQAQSFKLPGDLDQQIDDFYREWRQEGYPGGAVAIVHEGELVFAKGYGLASLEHGVPFTPETVSDIGSVAKQLTCFGIVLLAQQGKLGLDDDIRRYLHEAPDFGRPITIRRLMNHTSGLREIYAAEGIRGYRPGDGILQEDALRLVLQSRELNFAPGEQYSYCNTGYMLLADIISRVSGQEFETWMQENIFRPLGMDHTFIMDKRGEVFPGCADSYEKYGEDGFVKIYDNSTVQGAGGVYTTLSDLVSWFNHLRRPKIGGKEAQASMLQRGILNNGDTLNYALGLTVDSYRGQKVIKHTGSSAGYRALLSYFPELDLGIIVKTNCPSVDREGLADLLLKDVLDEMEEEDSNSKEDSFPTPDPEELQTYTGYFYSGELETVYEIKVEGSRLVGRHFRNGRFELIPTGKGAFKSEDGFSCTIHYIRDDRGAVTGLRMDSGGVQHLWLTKME
jgi:CubicO group peptidase (beta-lactamase class C family)